MNSKPAYPIPPRTYTIGMWLFIAALAMLFGSSMLGYVMIRALPRTEEAIGFRPELHTLYLPATLWISTALILAASFTIHRALVAIRRERQQALRTNLAITLALAILFVLIQCPSLVAVLKSQRTSHIAFYGLIFTLILLHALHVVGGIVSLSIVTVKSFKGLYDHENTGPIRCVTIYWHFLDIVWLVMFGTMWVLG